MPKNVRLSEDEVTAYEFSPYTLRLAEFFNIWAAKAVPKVSPLVYTPRLSGFGVARDLWITAAEYAVWLAATMKPPMRTFPNSSMLTPDYPGPLVLTVKKGDPEDPEHVAWWYQNEPIIARPDTNIYLHDSRQMNNPPFLSDVQVFLKLAGISK